jgi:hypothetical protein
MRAKHNHDHSQKTNSNVAIFASNFLRSQFSTCQVDSTPRRQNKQSKQTHASLIFTSIASIPAVKTRRQQPCFSITPIQGVCFRLRTQPVNCHRRALPHLTKKAAARLVFPWPSLGTGDASVQWGIHAAVGWTSSAASGIRWPPAAI